mgnify:CR=1 FL=1
MKILIIQENGRHEKNRHFRECYSLQRSFEKLEHEVTVWGLGHDNFEIQPDYHSYDLIFNLENYAHTSGDWLPDLSDISALKLLWAIDTHCLGEEIFENYRQAGKYDFILHSVKDFVTKDYHLWFPNSFDDSLIKPLDIDTKYDIGFCGNYANRKDLLEWLSHRHGLRLDIFVIGDDMVEAVNSYGCHFNMNMAWNINSAINYRNFETIGCGTLLLTSHSLEYKELGFEDGVNCLIYSNIGELEEKIDFVKKNDVGQIKQAGLELSKLHTYDKRVQALLRELKL